VIYLDLDK